MNNRKYITINYGKNNQFMISYPSINYLIKNAPSLLENMIKYNKKIYNLLEKDADQMRKSLKLELDKLKR